MLPPESLIAIGVVMIAAGQLWAIFRNAKSMQKLWDAYESLGRRIEHPLRIVPQSKSKEISETLNSDSYLTAEQVSGMLQVSKATIYTWATNGYMPALKIKGGSRKNVWRFSRKEIEEWIAEKRQPVTAEKELFNVDGKLGEGIGKSS